jgi:hypothetical protein
MLGWRFVCLLAAGFAVATTLVQADQQSDDASLLVLAADAQVNAKADPKTNVKSEPKADTKAEAKAAVKADAKTDVKADAKADAKAGTKAKTSGQTINERVAMWLKTCLQDWDTATHMSKDQWRTTCERVSKERGKFLSETPESLSLPGKR